MQTSPLKMLKNFIWLFLEQSTSPYHLVWPLANKVLWQLTTFDSHVGTQDILCKYAQSSLAHVCQAQNFKELILSWYQHCCCLFCLAVICWHPLLWLWRGSVPWKRHPLDQHWPQWAHLLNSVYSVIVCTFIVFSVFSIVYYTMYSVHIYCLGYSI